MRIADLNPGTAYAIGTRGRYREYVDRVGVVLDAGNHIENHDGTFEPMTHRPTKYDHRAYGIPVATISFYATGVQVKCFLDLDLADIEFKPGRQTVNGVPFVVTTVKPQAILAEYEVHKVKRRDAEQATKVAQKAQDDRIAANDAEFTRLQGLLADAGIKVTLISRGYELGKVELDLADFTTLVERAVKR